MNQRDINSKTEPYYDPYLREIALQPYPVYKQLREKAPLYYNEKYDFYAVSRYKDVEDCFLNHETFISGKGGILELIKENIEMPAGTLIYVDPPLHTVYRRIVQRIFSPKRMATLESQIRDMAIQITDDLKSKDNFDFITDIGSQIPIRVIGKLLGIPEQDYQDVRRITDSKMITEEGKPVDYSDGLNIEQDFDRYVHWRIENPSDDVITEMLNVEFTDDNGVHRKLTVEELTTFVNLLAGAGNETTNRLIGWMGKLLAENSNQLEDLVNNPDLIPQAIEETLRLEPPAPHIGRYVAKDTVIQGKTVPAGSAILLIAGSANHDETVFENPDEFNIYRKQKGHMSFGKGIHTCIGNLLARMEAKIIFEELLKRIPTWKVDMEHASLSSTSTVRGWETLPAYVNHNGRQNIKSQAERLETEYANSNLKAPSSVTGQWSVNINTPTGTQQSLLTLETINGTLGGNLSGEGNEDLINEISYDSDSGEIQWITKIKKPMKLKLQFRGTVTGKEMKGKVKTGFMGSFGFTAKRCT